MSAHNNSYTTKVSGFTLIELMISLVLGLLISAAVMQVYLINTRTITVQQSASEVQDSSIFAMQSIEEHVRLANLGNPINYITDSTDHGGIVLAQANLGNANSTDVKYFTIDASTGVSNIKDIASDQLTIQYKNITPDDLYDCEGGKVEQGEADWVVERYFVRLANGASSSDTTKNLVLACSAGRVDADGNVTAAFTDNGAVVVAAVDQFKVLLGAQADVDKLTYLPPSVYALIDKPTDDEKPAITSVKLGMIVRSNTPLIADADADEFTLLGATHTLKTDTTRKKYYRRSYESTVLLRSARVMSVVATVKSTP
ncbi:PilW family protein [Psychrobacter celer]|uniref:PilW family protein n=1 Tax=Psychrobacter celer TaxID=306572 RepID=UPI003FD4FD3F